MSTTAAVAAITAVSPAAQQSEKQKPAGLAKSRWHLLLQRGGRLLRAWLSVAPPLSFDGLLDLQAVRALRSYIFSTLKGNFSLRSLVLDPPLPTPELVRDEFNAYRKTILQEHLYGMIFKESSGSETTEGASTGCGSLMDMPALGPELSPDLSMQLTKMELSALELISEVLSG